MKILGLILVALLIGVTVTPSQDAKPDSSPTPPVKVSNERRLEYLNLVLSLSNIQLQMQSLQQNGQQIDKDRQAMLVDICKGAKLGPEECSYDPNTGDVSKKK